MSVVVAVEKDGRQAMAWSAGFSADSVRNVNRTAPSRALSDGSTCIAGTGLSVYCNLLEEYIGRRGYPRLTDERSVFSFWIEFWRALQSDYHFIRGDWDSDAPTPFADSGAEFLVLTECGMFSVKEILSVSRYTRFCAIGSGASHAEGALEALYESKMSCKQLAVKAVEIAMKFDPNSFGSIDCYEPSDPHGA